MKRLIIIIFITLSIQFLHAQESESLDVFTVTSSVEKTEYKDVANLIAAIIILETGRFTSKDWESKVEPRIQYFRDMEFSTDREGFLRDLQKIPAIKWKDAKYADDPDYIGKVKAIARSLNL